jgi:hypothetical protein
MISQRRQAQALQVAWGEVEENPQQNYGFFVFSKRFLLFEVGDSSFSLFHLLPVQELGFPIDSSADGSITEA